MCLFLLFNYFKFNILFFVRRPLLIFFWFFFVFSCFVTDQKNVRENCWHIGAKIFKFHLFQTKKLQSMTRTGHSKVAKSFQSLNIAYTRAQCYHHFYDCNSRKKNFKLKKAAVKKGFAKVFMKLISYWLKSNIIKSAFFKLILTNKKWKLSNNKKD